MMDKNGVITWRLTAQAAQIIINAVEQRPLKEVAQLHQNLIQQSQPEPEQSPQETLQETPQDPPQDQDAE